MNRKEAVQELAAAARNKNTAICILAESMCLYTCIPTATPFKPSTTCVRKRTVVRVIKISSSNGVAAINPATNKHGFCVLSYTATLSTEEE